MARVVVDGKTWFDPFNGRMLTGLSIGFVYFIQIGASGAIKIGWSKDPNKRLIELQVSHPKRLRMLGLMPGGIEDEKEMHRRFAYARIGGEWFAGRIFDHVIEMIADFGIMADFAKKSRNSPEPKRGPRYFCYFSEVSESAPTAPKADALPGCATPRTAEALRFRPVLTQAETSFAAMCGGTRREQARRLPDYSRTASPTLSVEVVNHGD